MTVEELFAYYKETFLPIYADLVAVLGEKPQQIHFELESVLSHTAVAFNNPEVADENIKKAYSHLERASLDAVKILWLHYRDKASNLIMDSNIRKFASNLPERKLLDLHNEAEELSKTARKEETEKVGIHPTASVNSYFDAACKYIEVCNNIDPQKVNEINKFTKRIFRIETLVAFIVGCASSGLISIIF